MNVHEPIHDTGERRTWPNMMTREGSRGQEYNAWAGDGGNPPEHETILFFTRLIPGPMDFTPGVLDILRPTADGDPPANHEARIRTTVAKQLALYVVLWSYPKSLEEQARTAAALQEALGIGGLLFAILHVDLLRAGCGFCCRDGRRVFVVRIGLIGGDIRAGRGFRCTVSRAEARPAGIGLFAEGDDRRLRRVEEVSTRLSLQSGIPVNEGLPR